MVCQRCSLIILNFVLIPFNKTGNCQSVRVVFWVTSSLVFACLGYSLGQTGVYRNLILRNGPSHGAALAHVDGGEKLLDAAFIGGEPVDYGAIAERRLQSPTGSPVRLSAPEGTYFVPDHPPVVVEPPPQYSY